MILPITNVRSKGRGFITPAEEPHKTPRIPKGLPSPRPSRCQGSTPMSAGAGAEVGFAMAVLVPVAAGSPVAVRRNRRLVSDRGTPKL